VGASILPRAQIPPGASGSPVLLVGSTHGSGHLDAPPLAVEEAVGIVEHWLERPNVRFLLPGPRHLDLASGLLRSLGTAANLTTDVQLAALAIEYQGELHSNDVDFARFPGLRIANPLS
jgi:uncharacterized protein